jgi:hypothetical protein
VLLHGLGALPRWVERDRLGGPSVYYGPAPEGFPEQTIVVPLHDETTAYFASNDIYPVDRVHWVYHAGQRVPVLFGRPEADDLVASAFFWLSGWQERTIVARDPYGRFPYEASLQASWGTAGEPVVDAYRQVLADRLKAAGFRADPPTWGGAGWAFCPTHDIDYIRKWRPGIVYREAVEYPLLNRRRVPAGARWRRLVAAARQAVRRGDPFRSALERMIDEAEARGGRATYFFKAGAHGPHDVAYRLETTFLRGIFRRLRDTGSEIGLHPSFHAHDHGPRLQEERDRLRRAYGSPIVSVRQHYLRYDPAITPDLHAEAGFALDSTLGFSDHEGFRHATCHPFPLFDHQKNEASPVWEMPLCMMDAALFNRRHLSMDEAVAVSCRLIESTRRVGGVCVMLWHNTLWDDLDAPGWGAHFTATLDAAVAAGGAVTTLRDALEKYRADLAW